MDKSQLTAKKIREKVIGVIFLIVIFLMFVLVLSGAFIQKIAKRYVEKTDSWKASVYYPLEKDIYTDEDSVLDDIFNKITALETRVEEKVTSEFYFRMPFVLTKKISDKVMGLDMTTSLSAGKNDPDRIDDIVLEYEDDYLGYAMDDADISEKIDNVVTFGNQMVDEGRNFLFFMNPEKYGGNAIYQDYSEAKEEEIINEFEINGLDILCASEAVEQEGMDMTSLFFKTDHHWLPSTGIYMDGILCRTLNQKYDYSFDTSVFDMENYETTVLEKHFLGSLGKKVTEAYCEREDFPLILPRFDTDLEVFLSNKNKTVRGSLQDTLLDYTVFDNKDIYLRNDYAFYGYGDRALITVHNNNIHDGSRILMIKSSFADCMYPYLASVVENLDVIDLRVFDGSLQSYINETDPDTIVVVYGVASFEGDEIGEGLFDFR